MVQTENVSTSCYRVWRSELLDTILIEPASTSCRQAACADVVLMILRMPVDILTQTICYALMRGPFFANPVSVLNAAAVVFLVALRRVEVVQGGARPILRDAYWPQRLSALVARCWGSDIDRRPSFSAVVRELR